MGVESQDFVPETGDNEPQPGPSWQRANWPLAGAQADDELTFALDPLAFREAITASAKKHAVPLADSAIEAPPQIQSG